MTAVLWRLIVALALGRLLYVIGRNTRASAASLEAPRFDVFAFDALPPAVARKLAPLRAGFLALGFRDLVSYLRRGPRTNHTTVHPGLRRFETSPVEILANMTVAGELELLIVSESTPLAEAAQRHEAGARAFAARTNLEALPVETAEQLFEIQRGIMARMAARLRPSAR